MAETLDEICKLVDGKKKSYVVAINVDVIMKMETDEYLKRITDEANLTLVDGKPLVWISKWHKRPVKAKISGSDMVPELCRVAAKRGYSIFIIGGAEGVAEKAKENLEKYLKDIKKVGTYSPPFGFEKDEKELDKINTMISDVHPDFVITCFGCPNQGKWNYKKYDATVSICAGATVDFLAGTVSRAHEWMREHGFEWIYRVVQELKRLFKRDLVDDEKLWDLCGNIGKAFCNG